MSVPDRARILEWPAFSESAGFGTQERFDPVGLIESVSKLHALQSLRTGTTTRVRDETALNAVAFHLDGATIADCSDDQTTRLWQIQSG